MILSTATDEEDDAETDPELLIEWIVTGGPPYFKKFIEGLRNDEGDLYRVEWRSGLGGGHGYVRAADSGAAVVRARAYHPDHIRVKGVESP